VSKKPYRRGQKRRAEIAQKELIPLSRLIRAMFADIAVSLNSSNVPFHHLYDRLDPAKDKCLNKEPWHTGVDGDFYFVFRLQGDQIYVVFGDATGHFDYAGGIKLFIAAVLRRLIDKYLVATTAPTAAQLLKELDGEFHRVGSAALRRNAEMPLEDGANVIVLRISPRGGMAEYASAGVPVRAMAHDGAIAAYGKMIDRWKMISFPKRLGKPAVLDPTKGRFPLAGVSFLIFITDGFEKLGRLPSVRSGKKPEKMGARRIERALQSLFRPKNGRPKNVKSRCNGHSKVSQLRAVDLAAAVIREAQRWRKHHFVPEDDDDDRLVLVVDVRHVPASQQRGS
jgi:hypothetical protein